MLHDDMRAAIKASTYQVRDATNAAERRCCVDAIAIIIAAAVAVIIGISISISSF